MSVNIEMPKLSDTMTEGTLVKWHKQIGDTVEIGDILAEIETDKATMEMEAFDDGVLTEILINTGEKAMIGSVLAILDGTSATPSGVSIIPQTVIETTPGIPASPATITPSLSETISPGIDEPRTPSSPLARKIAAELGIDLSTITGTGPGGRITRTDVENSGTNNCVDTIPATHAPIPQPVPATPAPATPVPATPVPATPVPATPVSATPVPSTDASAAAALAASIKTKAITPASPVPQELPATPVPSAATPSPSAAILPIAKPGDQRIELSTMRKVIASRLLISKTTIPHFYLHIEVDAAPLMALRQQVNDQTQHTHGNKYSVNDFILKAVINATQAVPAINAAFAGDHIVKFQNIGLCIAVAVEDGLVTPVIKDADSKSLLAISLAVKDFAVRAKERKLRPDEFDGGTITVSNLGAWGIESFDAIVNPPQAAILSVGAAIEKPVVKDGMIVPGLRINLGLSCDHRVVDGAVGAQFLSQVRKYIEQPALMLL